MADHLSSTLERTAWILEQVLAHLTVEWLAHVVESEFGFSRQVWFHHRSKLRAWQVCSIILRMQPSPWSVKQRSKRAQEIKDLEVAMKKEALSRFPPSRFESVRLAAASCRLNAVSVAWHSNWTFTQLWWSRCQRKKRHWARLRANIWSCFWQVARAVFVSIGALRWKDTRIHLEAWLWQRVRSSRVWTLHHRILWFLAVFHLVLYRRQLQLVSSRSLGHEAERRSQRLLQTCGMLRLFLISLSYLRMKSDLQLRGTRNSIRWQLCLAIISAHCRICQQRVANW